MRVRQRNAEGEMRTLAIVPRHNCEIRLELDDSITCLIDAGIDPRAAVIGSVCALIWVDDEKLVASVEALRCANFQATALTETDEPW
jgi:hypothetical protein